MAKYNNKNRKHSINTRQKISIGLKTSIKVQNIKEKNKELRKTICEYCGKEFYNLPGKHNKTCSKECRKLLISRKLSEVRRKEIENGINFVPLNGEATLDLGWR